MLIGGNLTPTLGEMEASGGCEFRNDWYSKRII